MSGYSDSEYEWETKALPAGLRTWAQAYAGLGINSQGRFMRYVEGGEDNYYSETETAALDASIDMSNPLLVDTTNWEPRSFLHAADLARNVADATVNGKNWWDIANYEAAMSEDATTFIAAARQILKDRLEYVQSADFGGLDQDFGSDWYNADEQKVDISGYTTPGVSYPTSLDTYLFPFDKAGTQYPTSITAETTNWDHPEIIETLRDFAYGFIDNLEMDSMVTRYRLALEAEYEARSQRNAALLYFAGAASTSPAALESYRRSNEIERMCAAYRADILRAILPDSNSITSIFHAFVADAQRIDNFNLERARQILTGRMGAIDHAITVAVSELNAEQTFISQEIAAKVNLAIAALDARLKITVAAESSRLDVLRIMLSLDQALAELQLKQLQAAVVARQEMQTNRMKAAMWRMEIAEGLMNAATVPLGVPMAPPEPSKFETRLSAGISTGINMATALAGFGNPALSTGVGLVGGLLTGFLPSFD